MDAPEIFHLPGSAVVSEFLTAVQASDVGFSAKDGSVSGFPGWHCHAQGYREALMPVGADINKTKQCPEKERDPEHHTPPRLCTAERSFCFGRPIRCQTIPSYRPLASTGWGLHFLRLSWHVNTSSGRMLNAATMRVCSVVDTYAVDRLFVSELARDPRLPDSIVRRVAHPRTPRSRSGLLW